MILPRAVIVKLGDYDTWFNYNLSNQNTKLTRTHSTASILGKKEANDTKKSS